MAKGWESDSDSRRFDALGGIPEHRSEFLSPTRAKLDRSPVHVFKAAPNLSCRGTQTASGRPWPDPLNQSAGPRGLFGPGPARLNTGGRRRHSRWA